MLNNLGGDLMKTIVGKLKEIFQAKIELNKIMKY